MTDGNEETIVNALISALKNQNPDSLEIGTAGKGGQIKVYGSFSRPEEFQSKIDKAMTLRAYAQSKLGGVEQ